MMKEVTLDGVFLDTKTKTPVVLLKDSFEEYALPIFITKDLGKAILLGKKDKLPRPMTHDLLTNFLDTWSMNLERIVINNCENNTYFAVLVVKQNGTIKEIDCRPSDAIALALRTNSPILVSETLMNNFVSLEDNKDSYITWQDSITQQKKESKFSFGNFLKSVT